MSKSPLRVLFELRPALGGHAGIPQETRLLFRGLSMLDDIRLDGLLQSNEHLLAHGLPPTPGRWRRPLEPSEQLDRLGRVVISLEQGTGPWHLCAAAHAVAMALRHLVGGSQGLSRFDASQFRDFIWRRFFSITLPPEDLDIVTNAAFRIARVPWYAMQICAMVTRTCGYSLFPRLDTSDFDAMVTETPYPASTSPGTRLIVRYHDAIPLLMPHTISDRKYHQSWHYHALRRNMERGAWFVCVSDATRNDLLSIFPQAEARTLTIHNMVSHHYFAESSNGERVPEIIKTRLNPKIRPPLDPGFRRSLFSDVSPSKPLDFLLIVSTIEPRKNHLTLLSAWEKLRVDGYPNLKLLVVGALGWHQKRIVQKFRPWMERGDVLLLADLPSAELRLLYKHARATVCPSYGEGFDFSGVEAMKSGGVVVASDIPVHREVYVDAAEFFNPYSVEALKQAIKVVIDPANPSRRDQLIDRGAVIAERYSHREILPKWHSFLMSQPVEA